MRLVFAEFIGQICKLQFNEKDGESNIISSIKAMPKGAKKEGQKLSCLLLSV